MKISAQTVGILKNFQGIDTKIVIDKGSKIRTMAKGSMLAVATVPEVFEQTFGIYDLAGFLGCLSLFNEPELTFHGEYMTIAQGNQHIRFTFTDPRHIESPPVWEIPMMNGVARFPLSSQDIKSLSRSSGLLKTPDFRILSENGNIVCKTCEDRNKSGNEYSVIGPETDSTFDFVYTTEMLTALLQTDYEVTLDSSGIASFVSENVTYFLGGKSQR